MNLGIFATNAELFDTLNKLDIWRTHLFKLRHMPEESGLWNWNTILNHLSFRLSISIRSVMGDRNIYIWFLYMFSGYSCRINNRLFL